VCWTEKTWNNEFLAFKKLASDDKFGLKVKLANGEFEKLFANEFDYKQRYGVVLWKLGKRKEALSKFSEAIKEYELVIKLRRPQMIYAYYGMMKYFLTPLNKFEKEKLD